MTLPILKVSGMPPIPLGLFEHNGSGALPTGLAPDSTLDSPFVDDASNSRLQRRIARRSHKYGDTHRHRVDDVDNPFIVTLRDALHSSVRTSRKGFRFVVMKAGTTLDVKIDDQPSANFLFRRFLTPHIVQGSQHIDVSGLTPDFLHRSARFSLFARQPGLVRILALDMRGRCRGELVISVKQFRPPLSVAFVRLRNAGDAGSSKGADVLSDASLYRLIRDTDAFLGSQTGVQFRIDGAPTDEVVPFDVSKGLADTDFKSQLFTRGNLGADFTVYLATQFKKPFEGRNTIVGVAEPGQFATEQHAVIALSAEAWKSGRPHLSLAHEICHSLIDKKHYGDLDFDRHGHYANSAQEGLMTGGKTSATLRWRDVNVINPTGLGKDGLPALIANNELWRDSGS